MPGDVVSAAEFARLTGVSKARITVLVNEGRLGKAVKRVGRRIYIDVAHGQRALSRTLDPNNHRQKIRKSIGELEKQVEAEDSDGSGGGRVRSSLDFTTARTLSEQYRAGLRKLEYDEKVGKLVDAAKVKEAAFDCARRVRDSILNIPDRLSAILAAESDERAIREILNKELKAALEELSKSNV